MYAPLLLAGAAGVGTLVVIGVGFLLAPGGDPALRDGHGWRRQWLGMGAGAAVALTVAVLDGPQHHLLLTLSSCVGVGWLVGALAAERSRPLPTVGPVVTADLTRRTPALYLGRAAVPVMRGIYLVTGSVLVVAMATASVDDPASFVRMCSARVQDGAGPWPGAPYAVPGLIGLAVGWALTEVVLRRIASRAAPAGLDCTDQDLRVVASRTALVSATLIATPNLGVAMVMIGGVLGRVCPTSSSGPVGTALLLAGLATMAVSVGAWFVALASGGRGVVPPVPAQP